MGKVARFLRRPPGMAVEELRAAWAGAPGELSWATDESYRKGEPLFDGLHEAVSPVDAEGPGVALTLHVVEEVVVKDAPVPAGALRFVGFATMPPSWEREAYQWHWRSFHGPLAARNPHMARYVQNHTADDATLPDGRHIGGYATVWFADMAALRASAASPEYAAVVEDERTFLEGPPAFFIAR